MFKKLHRQLTFICTSFTAIIVCIITLLCLQVSEQSQREKEYQYFLTNTAAVRSHLLSEQYITPSWYYSTEKDSGLRLYIEDNETPLLLCTAADDARIAEIRTSALEFAQTEYDFSFTSYTGSSSVKSTDFLYPASDGNDYYVELSFLPRENGALHVTMLYSLHPFQQTIQGQRLKYGLISALAVILLAGASWIFTGRVLTPVEESRQKQIAFIAAASHELRAPLTVLRSGHAARKTAPPALAARFDEITELELGRMSRLVDDMLSLSRADAGSWSLCRESCNLTEILRPVADSFQTSAAAHNLALQHNLSETGDLNICCDPDRISQLLIILLDNAITYTPAGGSIQVCLERQGTSIQLSVADTGPGIPDAEKESVFDRFYRHDKSHQSKDHAGLGLSIAREIIRLHNGKILLKDRPGGGSIFVVYLPAR